MKTEPTCNWCGDTGKIPHVPVNGKQPGARNCPKCNRNGRRKPRPINDQFIAYRNLMAEFISEMLPKEP